MMTLFLGFVLGWSCLGLIWCFFYDRMNEKIAIALMGPPVWITGIIVFLLSRAIDFYLKHKYYYVLFYNTKTKQVRVVNTKNKEECIKDKNEMRMSKTRLSTVCNRYNLDKSCYNRFDYFFAKHILNIYLDSQVILNKRLVNKIKNELE